MAVVETPIIRELVSHIVTLLRRIDPLERMSERRGVDRDSAREVSALLFSL